VSLIGVSICWGKDEEGDSRRWLMLKIEIRRMLPSDVEVVAELDSYAYLNNPGAIFLYGGNSEKERKLQEKARIALYTNNPQETYVAVRGGNIVGVIRSVPCSGEDFLPNFPLSKEEYTKLASKKTEQLSFEERYKWWMMTWKKHDPTTAHSHVGPVAVSPELQGQGIGSKLMRDYHVRLDRTGIPSYLETTKPMNVRFYEKHGYKIIETEYALGFEHYFMWRDAQPG
jgi:predicted N-acetyltransferase YhbS